MTIEDSRELEDELQTLIDLREAGEEHDTDALKQLEELKEECDGHGWECGICFIPDYEFKNYCQELAEDCGMVPEGPMSNYVDWDSWAEDCEQDYSEVEFRGTTYLWREA